MQYSPLDTWRNNKTSASWKLFRQPIDTTYGNYYNRRFKDWKLDFSEGMESENAEEYTGRQKYIFVKLLAMSLTDISLFCSHNIFTTIKQK